MKPSIRALGEILYSPSQYVIPVFQRNYRWEEPQWVKLWEGLQEIQSPEKRGNHFMGFLVFVPGLAQPGQNTTFHLIDGQQRLTTSSLLLTAVRNVARRVGQADLADEIHSYYLVHPLKKGDQHYRLLPKERDHDSYLALVGGKGAVSGRMADAVAYFESRLSTLPSASPDALRQTFDAMCQRLEFMCATLETENAYNIFKSLNSTGVPLGSSDLIRNFVFMHVAPDEHDEFDRELWSPLEDTFTKPDGVLDEERFSRFFRDFLMSSGRYVQPKETFDTFEARYEATGFVPRELALSLADGVKQYRVISGAAPDADDCVTRSLAGLNALESSTTYPLLLALFQRRASGSLASERLAHCIEMLRGFIMRRFVCGESSRGYGQMFVRAVDQGAADPVLALESYLLARGWPADPQFEAAFVDIPLYQRGYPKEVLVALERASGHKEPADVKAAQVEHVMPQTLNDAWVADLGKDAESIHQTWLHRPGNLTLSAYNQELWNHPFSVKKVRYADSNIGLTRELAAEGRWGQNEISERGHRLALQASRIWIGPKAPVAVDEAEVDDEGPGRRELRMRFWRALHDVLVAEFPKLPEIETRPNSTIRLPSGVRYIGLELRYKLRRGEVGIDIWFWRQESLPLWESIGRAPSVYNAAVGGAWGFERSEGRARGRMFLVRSVTDLRDESAWPEIHRWLGEKLTLTYDKVCPLLRDGMRELGPD